MDPIFEPNFLGLAWEFLDFGGLGKKEFGFVLASPLGK